MSLKLKTIKVMPKICKRCENKVVPIIKSNGNISERSRCNTCESPSWTLEPKGKFIFLKDHVTENYLGKTKDIPDEIIIESVYCNNCKKYYFSMLEKNGKAKLRKKCPFCNVRSSKEKRI